MNNFGVKKRKSKIKRIKMIFAKLRKPFCKADDIRIIKSSKVSLDGFA